MRLALLVLAALASLAAGCGSGRAVREYIHIVGSSTVYPFSTVVAEQFGQKTRYRTPLIEATGTGGGIKLFCAGAGFAYPDIANASRRIKPSEVANCAAHGIDEIVEVQIGYDGIVLGVSRESTAPSLSLRQLYLALARQVPAPGGAGGGRDLVDNPYTHWSEIDSSLPPWEIRVFGPPPTSGTRDAFVELAMEAGCRTFPAIAALEKGDPDRFRATCQTMREDGRFVEAGENDNLIVKKLTDNREALGIFGFSFLEENLEIVHPAVIGGVTPTFDSIADGSYPISRPLYFYVKKSHARLVEGLPEFLAEFTSEDASGPFGYLSYRGLVPLREQTRMEVAREAAELKPLELSDS